MPLVGIWMVLYTVVTVQLLVDFWEVGVWPSTNGVVMSLLRHQTTMECISHPYQRYRKCFSILICKWWAYGCTLTLLHLCRGGVDFWEVGVWPSPSDIEMSWFLLQAHLECFPHPYHIYRKCLAPWYAMDVHMGGSLHCCVCSAMDGFLDDGGMTKHKWCCNVMVEAPNHHGVLPTSTSYI